MVNEIVEIRRLPGIEDTWNGFCVHPDGSIALFYDYVKKTFVQVDLKTGRKTFIQTKIPEELQSTPIIDLVAVVRSSQLFIIALAYGEVCHTIKSHSTSIVVSFSYDYNTRTISFVDEHRFMFQVFPHFYKDELDNLYLLSWDSSAVFGAAQINIHDSGKLKTDKLLSKTQSLKYASCAAFIHGSALYFIPEEDEDKTQLLKIPFGSEKFVEVEVGNVAADDSPTDGYSRPQVFNDNVFFYNHNYGMQSHFLNLDLKGMCWRRVFVDFSDHNVEEYWPSIASDWKGLLYMHGNCRFKSCKAKAHIYVIKPNVC